MEGKIIISEALYKNIKLSELMNTVSLAFQKADHQSKIGIDTYKIMKELKSKGITLEII